MTLGDMREAERKERDLQRENRNQELLKELLEKLDNPEIKFYDVNVDLEKYDEAGCVSLSFELKDGFKQEDDFYWEWNESVDDIADKIVKHILYIEQLRKDYPNYAAQNDYIQKHRKFFRKCKSSHSDCKEFYIKAELCGMLKLSLIHI